MGSGYQGSQHGGNQKLLLLIQMIQEVSHIIAQVVVRSNQLLGNGLNFFLSGINQPQADNGMVEGQLLTLLTTKFKGIHLAVVQADMAYLQLGAGSPGKCFRQGDFI